MIDPENTVHVYPVNDLREHNLDCIFPVIGPPYCECACLPEYTEEGESLIVVHNSFDGRENFEVDNPVRLN